MSVLNKSGGSTVPGSCYISNGAMHGIPFHLLITREENLCCVSLRCNEAKKGTPSVGHLPVDDQRTPVTLINRLESDHL